MKRIFIIISFLAQFFALAYAQMTPDADINFSAGFSFGVMNGEINEYVEDENHYNNHMSQLDWDIKNIKIADINTDILIERTLLIKTDIRFGFAGESGFMQDYDWLNPVSWPKDPLEELTNYSKHTNILTKYYKISETLGVNLYLPLRITLTPFMMFEKEEIDFDGIDGYSLYKSNNWEEKSFSGNVISYQQDTKMLFFGLALNFMPFHRAGLQISGAISPKITDVDAIDRHRLTRVAYWDHVYKGTMYKAQTSLYFNAYKWRFNLNGEIYYLPEATGFTSQARLDSEGNVLNEFSGNIGDGGTSRFLQIYSLTAIYRF